MLRPLYSIRICCGDRMIFSLVSDAKQRLSKQSTQREWTDAQFDSSAVLPRPSSSSSSIPSPSLLLLFIYLALFLELVNLYGPLEWSRIESNRIGFGHFALLFFSFLSPFRENQNWLNKRTTANRKEGNILHASKRAQNNKDTLIYGTA